MYARHGRVALFPLDEVWADPQRDMGHPWFSDRSFAPMPTTARRRSGAEAYEIIPGWVAVFELSSDRRSFWLMVVDWSNPAAPRHYAVWTMHGLEATGREGYTLPVQEGTVEALDFGTVQGGPFDFDRLDKKQK